MQGREIGTSCINLTNRRKRLKKNVWTNIWSGRVSEVSGALKALRDQDLWRDMIANAKHRWLNKQLQAKEFDMFRWQLKWVSFSHYGFDFYYVTLVGKNVFTKRTEMPNQTRQDKCSEANIQIFYFPLFFWKQHGNIQFLKVTWSPMAQYTNDITFLNTTFALETMRLNERVMQGCSVVKIGIS